MTETILILDGLDCASCANKIETESKNISGVIDVSLNFVSKKLKLSTENSKEEEIISQVKDIVHKYEPNVEVSLANEKKYIERILIMDGLD